MNTELIQYFFYNLLGALCGYFSFIYPLPEKILFKNRIIIFTFLLLSVLFFEPFIGQFVAFIALAGTLFLVYIFTSTKKLSIFCALFGYLTSVVLNQLYLWIIQLIFSSSIELLLQKYDTALILASLYCMICFIISKFLGWLLNKKLKIAEVFVNENLVIALLPSLTFLTALFIFDFSYGDRLGYSRGVIVFNGITFLILFVLSVRIVYFVYRNTIEEEKNKNRENQYKLLEKYTETLEKSYGNLRLFKHDYLNTLISLSGYITDQDYIGLKTYFNEKIIPLGHQIQENDSRIGILSNMKIPEIKGILSSKLIYSIEIGIQTIIEIVKPVETIPMNTLDFVRILGIYLDNAIEAAIETEEKLLHLAIFYNDQNLYVIVKNSTVSLPIPISKLSQCGVSSKGFERGLGLYQASQILGCYSNVIQETRYDEPYFIQTLIITIL